MTKSMTGFGRGKYQQDGLDFTVEIKTVNHRYCDVFVRLPRHLNFLEEKVREYIGKAISRGKADIYISCEEYFEGNRNVVIDEPLAKAYFSALGKLKDTFALRDEVTIALLTRFPDVLRVEKDEQDEDIIWNILKVAVEESINSLIKMRIYEGESLKKSILEKIEYIDSLVIEIEKYSPEVVRSYKQKLENRLSEIIELKIIDENRIATEVAIFADRCCVDEEIVRLKSHNMQFKEILNSDSSVGRKLEFLLQEMNREINTIGSKANDVAVTRNIVEAKSELEKIREQIQNIE